MAGILTISLGKEFSAVGAPPQELQRKLLYLAESGSGSVLSAHATMNGSGPAAQRDKADSESFETMRAFMQMQEREQRIKDLNDALAARETASYEALIENQKRLTKAKEELERLRERAYEITFPDGTLRKVYRDGDTVRTDEGAKVDPQIVKPGDIPDQAPTWAERRALGRQKDQLERQRDRITRYRERLDEMRERLGSDPSGDDLDALEKQMKEIPDSASGFSASNRKLERPFTHAATAPVDEPNPDTRPTPPVQGPQM